MISLFRICKFALQNFWRNFWLSVITISMLALTLVTIDILLVLNVVADSATKAFEDKVDVSVYFTSDATEEVVKSASAYVRSLEQVKNVQIITPEEALERFKTYHAGNATVLASLEEIGENPFAHSLIVKAYRAEDFDYIIQALDAPQYRDYIRNRDFSDYQQYIDDIAAATERVRWFGIALAVIFLVISSLIIFNTVRMTIFIHREEIGIMKLVGATDWFVRAPYLIEAFFYSALAVGLSAAILFPTLGFLEPKFDRFFEAFPTHLTEFFIQNSPLIFGTQFAAVSVLCILSTGFAMRRYLKV